jgi:hypothetical protein
MKKSEAISLHAKDSNWHKFAVMVWEEGDQVVTEVDGQVFRAGTAFGLDSLLDDAGIPKPRNLYFIDEPDYEE